MKGRRLWLRAATVLGPLPVYVTSRPIEVEGHPVDAYFDREKPEIVIEQVANVDLMKMRLHHELLHLCWGAHSGDARAPILGRTPEARARKEEAIVSFLEPVQFDLLVRNRWLKYPNPPKVK